MDIVEITNSTDIFSQNADNKRKYEKLVLVLLPEFCINPEGEAPFTI